MTDPRIDRLARIVVDYSLGLKAGEAVSIAGPPPAKSLLLAIYERALREGAFPHLKVTLPEATERFYRIASEAQLDHLSPIDLFEADHVQCSAAVIAESNTRALAAVPAEKIARVRKAKQPLKDAKRKQRWNVVTFPTDAYAQDAGMSLHAFEEFVFRACFCDEEDPVEAWRAFRERLRARAEALGRPEEIRIRGEGTDLTLGIGKRKVCVSCGEVNMPDGEIYFGPVEDAVEGVIRFSYPAILEGREIEEITFRFEKGVVVEAKAARNQDLLDKMLDVDEGARRVGELGIGCNFGVDRFTRNLLFDEKIGGTVHLGMGESYPETEGQNHSAIHIDFLCDIREEGEVTVDGKTLLENGSFLI
ncbi:MAG: aminopeptidase [Planctomycetota bacterium]|jgi:aminopeptidase